MAWIEASCDATLYTYSVSMRGRDRWAEVTPYVVAYVELAEGPRILTNLIADNLDSLLIGAEVQMAIERAEGNPPVLRFVLR